MSDDLLNHYNRELGALRRLAAEFARAHPNVAGRLRLSENAVEDPHVSRLLEGAALLNARIRQKIDDEFPELTDALLDHLYPHYLAPIPSMAIVELSCQKDLAGSFTVPAHTEIETEPVKGETCRFATTQNVKLWPVAIEDARLLSRPLIAPESRTTGSAVAALRLTLRCRAPDQSFANLGIDSLRFFLRGPASITHPLYELMGASTVALAVAESADDPNALFLRPEALYKAGFGSDEGVLPTPARAAVGYRLLTEYFVFPEKFLFFEVGGLRPKTARLGSTLQLYLFFYRGRPELEKLVGTGCFGINCVPIVNLFPQRAEPIRLTRTQSEYRVVPDVRRPEALEVYSIERVTATSPDGETMTYRPFYSVSHAAGAPTESHFWYAARRPNAAGGPALESYLTLVDLDLDPQQPANGVLSGDTQCTNRDLPARLPFGGGHPILRLVKPLAAVTAVTAVTAPTATLRLPNREQGRWRLVSHLLLNHLSVTGGGQGADALKEMLRLYDYRDSPDTRAVIDAIAGIRSQQRTARVPGERGAVCRGIDIDMLLEDTAGAESGIYLLTAVLERVFALQATINSFTRLSASVRGKPEVTYRWPARAGDRPLL